MKVKDEAEWQLFYAEIAAVRRRRRRAVPRLPGGLGREGRGLDGCRRGHGDLLQSGALRNTLRTTETELGRWTVGFLGQMLVVLSTHWEPAGEPDDFFDP